VIKKPKGLEIGYSASIGAIITVLAGLTTLEDFFSVISIVWNATLTFISVVIISLIFDEAGVFVYLADKMLTKAKGSGKRLFVLVILGGAFISATFANDGTALILTPIIVALLYRAGFEKKAIFAYVMAVGFIADSASIPLLVSNLVNIIAATYFGIRFFSYMEVMILPDIVSVAVSLSLLFLYFRKSIPLNIPKSVDFGKNEIKDPLIFKIFFPMIILLIVLYSIGGFFLVPVSIVAMPAAFVMVLLARRGGKINFKKPIKEAPWQIILFSIGMYIIVYALAENGLVDLTAKAILSFQVLPDGLNFVMTGFLFAFTASIMNNLPSVLLGDLTLQHIHLTGLILLTNAIGNDIGPKFTPIGSLATLVWLFMLDRKAKMKIKTLDYMKLGIYVGIPVLFLTLMTLWLETLFI
jgi:arsenical pump membrane protein